jgi:peptidoglycan/LPS O-acetylase OafA/YrhL
MSGDVDTSAARPRGGRMLEIDGYRGVAALSIVVIHAYMQGGFLYSGTSWANTPIRGLDAAVSLFFALSGFVVFLPFVRGALGGRVPAGGKFLVRRLYRILPLYYIVILVVWSGRYVGTGDDWQDLFQHLIFGQLYDGTHLFWIDGPAWSLAVEMHFYVLIALVGPWLTRLAVRRATTAGKLGTMAILPAIMLTASLAFSTIAYFVMHVGLTSSITYYSPIARADSFALGLFLAILFSVPGALKVRPRLAVALTVVGFGSQFVLWYERTQHPALEVYYFSLAGLASLCLLGGAAILHERQLIGRVLRSRLLQLTSAVGFSMYLWHEPVMIQLVRWNIFDFTDPVAWPLTTLALMVTVTAVGWVSQRLIEEPGVKLQKLIDGMRARQRAGEQNRSGPAPRWLPDLTLAAPDGTEVALRDLAGGRPLLVAVGADGARRLDEQRFRLDAGEAAGVSVTDDGSAAVAGTTMLVDPDRRLADAMNVPAALIEVDAGGLITAVHAPSTPREVPRDEPHHDTDAIHPVRVLAGAGAGALSGA